MLKTKSLLLISIISFIIVLVISFYGSKISKKGINDLSYEAKLLIRGPGECVYLITFNDKGQGIIVRGKSENFYRESFVSLYEKNYENQFDISSKIDLDSLNEKISEVYNKETQTGGFATDTNRKELYINNEKKMDIYSWRSNDINSIEKYLNSHLPIEINYYCE